MYLRYLTPAASVHVSPLLFRAAGTQRETPVRWTRERADESGPSPPFFPSRSFVCSSLCFSIRCRFRRCGCCSCRYCFSPSFQEHNGCFFAVWVVVWKRHYVTHDAAQNECSLFSVCFCRFCDDHYFRLLLFWVCVIFIVILLYPPIIDIGSLSFSLRLCAVYIYIYIRLLAFVCVLCAFFCPFLCLSFSPLSLRRATEVLFAGRGRRELR